MTPAGAPPTSASSNSSASVAPDVDHRPSVAIRLGFVVAAVAIAAWPSLLSLFEEWRYQSAMAELAIVPAVFVALLIAGAARHRYVATARWGGADWWVAGLIAVAVPIALTAGRMLADNFFPAMRFDLLLLPLIAVASIVLMFGVRSLLAFAPAVAVLLLAWPLPFQAVLELTSQTLTAATGWAVGTVVDVVPIAEQLPSDTDVTLRVLTGDASFEVVVSSACAGAGGMAAFLALGVASFAFLAGSVGAKLRWLAAGLVLVFAANVARIVAILAAGRLFGEPAAIEMVHPVAGLLALNCAFLIMLVLARPMGLTRRTADPLTTDNPLYTRLPGDGPVGASVVGLRLTVLIVGAALLAGFSSLPDLGSGGVERPLVAPAVRGLDGAEPAGYRISNLGEQRWARPYFGEESRWFRFEAAPTTPGQPTVWIDSIVTDSVVALRSHSLVNCYRFHGYDVVSEERVELPGGVAAERYVYVTPDQQRWQVLAWQWPVRDGDRVRHERVVLMSGSAAELALGGGRGAGLPASAAVDADSGASLITLASQIAGRSR